VYAHIKLTPYLQNSSKPQLSQNCGISKQGIETKHWSHKSSGSERHVDICLSSLSLSPIFLLSISSLVLIRGSVILHSSSRFKQTLSNAFHPSSSPSLTHIHKSLLFCTQIHFSPHTPLSNESGSLCLSGGCISGTHLLLTINPLY